jgi:hypothetical protein
MDYWKTHQLDQYEEFFQHMANSTRFKFTEANVPAGLWKWFIRHHFIKSVSNLHLEGQFNLMDIHSKAQNDQIQQEMLLLRVNNLRPARKLRKSAQFVKRRKKAADGSSSSKYESKDTKNKPQLQHYAEEVLAFSSKFSEAQLNLAGTCTCTGIRTLKYVHAPALSRHTGA